jgi:hypothetical protein
MKWLTVALFAISYQILMWFVVVQNKATLNVPVCVVVVWFTTVAISATLAMWFDKRKELAYEY